jgi:hypothetical protein
MCIVPDQLFGAGDEIDKRAFLLSRPYFVPGLAEVRAAADGRSRKRTTVEQAQAIRTEDGSMLMP